MQELIVTSGPSTAVGWFAGASDPVKVCALSTSDGVEFTAEGISAFSSGSVDVSGTSLTTPDSRRRQWPAAADIPWQLRRSQGIDDRGPPLRRHHTLDISVRASG
ncbi:hypothetical protein [Nocardioides zhouii]|uniref:Uncharacterized protein n=1 Tax=Nocardioides zhouii TaxID=1168729 RepID=A0A4Q2T3P6_9ACTN|nr:hypothetical protein [Nocardioides zhouii]RYC13375.1 hypothetical protein EUA94_05780 [Nocardioides zhouii]